MPCSAYAPPAYGHAEHAAPQHYSHQAYRSSGDDAEGSLLPQGPNNDDKSASHTKTPSTNDDSVSSILSAPSTHTIEKGTNTENRNDGNDNTQKDATVSSSNQQTLSSEEAQKKKLETLMKMSELAKTLAADEKVNPQQQNQLPSSNTQKTNEKSTLSGPQPTSTNVGKNFGTNQANRQPLFPSPWKQ